LKRTAVKSSISAGSGRSSDEVEKGLEIDESEAGEAEVGEPQRQKLDIQVHEADGLPVQN